MNNFKINNKIIMKIKKWKIIFKIQKKNKNYHLINMRFNYKIKNKLNEINYII